MELAERIKVTLPREEAMALVLLLAVYRQEEFRKMSDAGRKSLLAYGQAAAARIDAVLDSTEQEWMTEEIKQFLTERGDAGATEDEIQEHLEQRRKAQAGT